MIGNHWNWVCHGKHLAAGDYFTLGGKSPLANAFCGWVNRGYEPLLAGNERKETARSWRFWAKSPAGHNLVCGIIKSSCDRLGRPFPLLVLGIGRLRGWQKHWELLPEALNPVWGQLEQFAAKRFQTFDQLKGDFKRFKRPRCAWSELQAGNGPYPQSNLSTPAVPASTATSNMQEIYSALQDNRKVLVPLSTDSSIEPGAMIQKILFGLKQGYPITPNVVFMGGGIDQPSLAIFMDALQPSDFTWLWSREIENDKDHDNDIEVCEQKETIF